MRKIKQLKKIVGRASHGFLELFIFSFAGYGLISFWALRIRIDVIKSAANLTSYVYTHTKFHIEDMPPDAGCIRESRKSLEILLFEFKFLEHFF